MIGLWFWRWVVPLVLALVLLGLALAASVVLLGVTSPLEVRWEQPWAFLLLLAAPFSLIVNAVLEWRRTPHLQFSRSIEFASVVPGPRVLFGSVPAVLRAVAIALVVIALARPQTTTRKEDAEVEGIDVALVLDLSNSMRATDLRPNRLEAMKSVIDDFILRRESDRLSAVVFGRDAFTLCPLTLDYSALRGMVRGLTLNLIDGRGTAIGNGLSTGINRLRHSSAKSKVIILLTDGDNNSGNISPDQAAQFAKALRIKVYSVLMGMAPEDAPQQTDLLGRPVPGEDRYPVRPELLRAVSEKTGGEFFHVADTRGLQQSFHRILNQLDRSKIADLGVLYSEVFGIFLFLAVGFVGIEVLLRLFVFRRVP